MALNSICQFFSGQPTVLWLLENMLQLLVNGDLENVYVFTILSYRPSLAIVI